MEGYIMLSRWVYILLGNDCTGKTTFQKKVIKGLCGVNKDNRLDTNIVLDITYPDAIRRLKTAFFANRSYQEKSSVFGSVQDYFENYFKDADVHILSSHLNVNDIKTMIDECHKRVYNVAGVFWSNAFLDYKDKLNTIALLNWDERLWFENPYTEDEKLHQKQIRSLAKDFMLMIVNRANIQ
jgi:hypothetical protein